MIRQHERGKAITVLKRLGVPVDTEFLDPSRELFAGSV